MDDATGVSIAEPVERAQVERVVGATAQVGDDVRPVGGAQLTLGPVDRVMAPVIEHEAEDATAAVAA